MVAHEPALDHQDQVHLFVRDNQEFAPVSVSDQDQFPVVDHFRPVMVREVATVSLALAVARADRVDRVALAVDVPVVRDQVQVELQVDAEADPDKLEVPLVAVAKVERPLVHKNRERLNARR